MHFFELSILAVLPILQPELEKLNLKHERRTAIEEKNWTRTVLESDYNRLKQEVAADIKAGEQDKALERYLGQA